MIRLTGAQLRLIERAAEAAYPEEACGLLVGHADPRDGLTVSSVAPSANVAPPPRTRRFEVDPSLRITLDKRLRNTTEAIVGAYHSHPDEPPEPSATDLRMAFEPELVWLITSVMGGRAAGTAAHRLAADRSRFESVTIRVIPDPCEPAP